MGMFEEAEAIRRAQTADADQARRTEAEVRWRWTALISELSKEFAEAALRARKPQEKVERQKMWVIHIGMGHADYGYAGGAIGIRDDGSWEWLRRESVWQGPTHYRRGGQPDGDITQFSWDDIAKETRRKFVGWLV